MELLSSPPLHTMVPGEYRGFISGYHKPAISLYHARISGKYK